MAQTKPDSSRAITGVKAFPASRFRHIAMRLQNRTSKMSSGLLWKPLLYHALKSNSIRHTYLAATIPNSSVNRRMTLAKLPL